jgi:hypothetical protein
MGRVLSFRETRSPPCPAQQSFPLTAPIAEILTVRTPKNKRHIQPSSCIVEVYGRGAKGGSIQLTARTVTPPQKWHLLKSRGIKVPVQELNLVSLIKFNVPYPAN